VVSEQNEKLTDMNDKNQDVLFLAQKNVILRKPGTVPASSTAPS
jgi:hypothetical protein